MAAKRIEGKFQELVEGIPLNQLLGIRVTKRHEDGVTLTGTMRDDLRNALGTLHGGVTATIADAAIGIAIMSHHQPIRLAATVEMKINYFIPIVEGRFTARAKLLRVGGSLVVGTAEVRDAKKQLAAFATATYKYLRPA
jgi:uncharacterized protein (TIGR00369 family)